jgi:hypothetical protein
MRDHEDTNCGPGMVYDTPEEKEIERLEKKLRAKDTELARLRAEVERLKLSNVRLIEGLPQDAVKELRTTIARLEADARRYQWLRDQRRWLHNMPPGPGITARWENYIDSGVAGNSLLDAAIDAAMNVSAPTGGGEG